MNSRSEKKLHGFSPTKYLGDDERYRLLYGPYKPPLIRRGFLIDAVRGKVTFSHFTTAPIPWPKCQKAKSRSGGGSGGYVLCGDLVRALTDESAPAVAHHWGVSHSTVTNWRRALELKGRSAGAHRVVEIGVELARRPESRAKISLANRGRRNSPKHKTRLHAGMMAGWKERFEARRAAYRKTGRFPNATKADPWIPEEEKLLGKYSAANLALIIGRTRTGIVARRTQLGIPPFPSTTQRPWMESETKILGTDMDYLIAARLKRTVASVTAKRQALGIRRRKI